METTTALLIAIPVLVACATGSLNSSPGRFETLTSCARPVRRPSLSAARRIRCRVSTEGLDDTTGHKGPHDPATMLAIYSRLRDRVHAAVDRKL